MKTSETNGATGITTVRELTSEEKQEIEESRAALNGEAERWQASLAAKESAKAKLAALGLTDEEINAIIGGV